ncbi:MAG: VWA domain-containing protein [Acidobacteria bacterium]|nr:MAG: VWA domain-containing protein [Acidobacteriota bacterium]
MRVRITFAILAAAMAYCVNLHAQQPQQPPPPPAPPPAPAPAEPPFTSGQSIRQNVNLVDVLFTVLNRQNRIVADLNRDNFRVFDDDAPQEIRFFNRQTDMPLRVGFLLDTSNSIRDRLHFEQQAAIDFLYNVIRRDKDQAFLMTVDDEPEMVQGFTGDLDTLREIILKQRAGGGTALYDAIYQACQQLLKLPPSVGNPDRDLRPVLVVISDGDDNLSRHSRGEALDIAQRAGIVIYTISTSTNWIVTDQEAARGDLSNRKYMKDEGDKVLQQFSDESGGRAFFPYHVDDLAQSFASIGDELRSQYSLAYVPIRPGDGKFHRIRIEVNTKGLQVRARKGYYAIPAEGAPSSASAR